MKIQILQTGLKLLYPPRCVLCGGLVEHDFGLCGACWRDTPFIAGLCCDLCGVPLPGDPALGSVQCDSCLKTARPWSQGRAALVYGGNARRLVLALKHGDRHDVAHLVRPWLIRAAAQVITDDTILVPVPLHWSRLLKRRFNQTILLAEQLHRAMGNPYCPDLLIRKTKTVSLGGLGMEARFQALDSAITANPKTGHLCQGRTVMLIDDVMTSGATLSACAKACFSAGARDVKILVLARVDKDA